MNLAAPLEVSGERRLLPPLLELLERTRKINSATVVVNELAWHGRRIDVVTLTSTGVVSSYELKLGSVGRVLEQAIYNALSFDRSWAVVDRVPSEEMLRLAGLYGVGMIVGGLKARIVLPAVKTDVDEDVHRQLLGKILQGDQR